MMDKTKKLYSASRWTEPPKAIVILCSYCKHYHIDNYDKLSCDAFPNGIPDEHIERGEDENTYQPIMLTKEMAKVCNNGIGFERGPQFPNEEI